MNDETAIRPLPHALGPEKSVLSSLMKTPGLIEEFPLDPEIFYLPAHRKLYRLLKAEGEFDFVAFTTRLHQRGELEEIGGPAAVTDIFTYAPNEQHFQRHLEIMRHCHARRMAIRAAAAAVEAAYDLSEGEESGNYLQALSGPITEVFDRASSNEPARDTRALAMEFLADFEKLLRGESLPMGIPTGIPEIDTRLNGLHPQHYGVISGRPSGGKSTLATQIAGNLVTSGTKVLYLILERTEISAFRRCVIQQARIRHYSLVSDPKQAKPNKEDLMRIRNAVKALADDCLHIRKPKDRGLACIMADIRRYVRQNGIKVVILDQIGLVRGVRQKGDTETAELKGVSNRLQELGHELGITLVVLCQENVDGDTKNARAIEEDADWWISIVQERDKKKENYGEHQYVLVAKDSHNGNTGERLPLILCKDNLLFVHGYPQEKNEKKPTGRRSFAN